MPTPRPWTDQDDEQLVELHGQGKTLGQCAEALRRSKGRVSEHAKRLGLDWDRTQTAKATEAARQDNRARRAKLVTRLYDRAEEFLDQVDKPHVVFNFGGKDNTYEERTLDRPPTGDIRNLMQSASIALQRARDLEAVDSDGGADAARGIIGALVTGLQAAYEQLPATDPRG